MRRPLLLVIATAVAAALLAAPVALAAPGGIFITGHDPDFHAVVGGNAVGARNTIKRAVEFVTSTAPADPQPSMLVVSSRIAVPAGHADSVLGMTATGYTFDVAAAADQGELDLTTVDFAAYDVVVVASDFGGILRQAELDILNTRSQDLIDFVNGGGGLVALAEGNGGAHLTPGGGHFDFLPFVASEVPLEQSEANTVTAFGASIGLTNDDVNGNFSHTVFSEPGGFDVVDVDGAVPARIVSMAMRGKKICPAGVPEASVHHDPTHHEGAAGDITPREFTVRLSLAPCDGLADVTYQTANGTADAADYTSQSGTLTFLEGETEKTVPVPVLGDNVFEPDETFFLNLTGATGAAILDGQGIGTILNDDQDPSLAAPPASILSGPEGATGDATPTFTFSSSTPGTTFECRIDDGAFAPCTSPFTASELAARDHVFEVRARDAAGNTGAPARRSFTVTGPPSGQQPPASQPLLPFRPGSIADRDRDGIPDALDRSDASVGPKLAKTVVAKVVSGTVLVKYPAGRGPRSAPATGSGFGPLKGAEILPIGSTVDSRRGRLALTSAASVGKTQTADFYNGIFQIRQARARKPVTELVVGSSAFSRDCGGRGSRGVRAASARRPRSSKKVVSQLWGNGKGNFRTRGRNSTATVRGTIWLTQERCDGTLTRVQQGSVAVRDLRAGRTVTVRAGRSYLARAARAAAKRKP